MRKNTKARLDSLLDLLAKAHDTIEKCLDNRQYEEAALVLEKCQDAAISIGTAIEESEGGNTETVPALEEYCEMVFVIYEALQNPDASIPEGATVKLNTDLQKINSLYEKEAIVRKEAVFLPYKASMWDSLESVWKRYEADPDWDVKVVPIPYYNKNPDGSFLEYHYEGKEYPEYVPVTFYKDYDLEANHPDEIYIHNPYDEANYVTSIEPFYYSKNIRNFTDRLIYIPYFVLAEPDPDSRDAIENISDYAQTPGVFYAHEVIVQSENMRRCYIEAMVMLAGEETRSVWENKIKGTGSPKFDRVIEARKNKAELPEEWKRKIYRKDNTAKKVILYNTSVTAFLRESENMLEKIMDVMLFFKLRTEDTVLLWRPHPLIKATIGSMRPSLLTAFEKIVEWYKAEDFGIYDDSADLDRAIAVADAYYGDPSSIVQLCQKVEMPIMIQNVHVRKREER